MTEKSAAGWLVSRGPPLEKRMIGKTIHADSGKNEESSLVIGSSRTCINKPPPGWRGGQFLYVHSSARQIRVHPNLPVIWSARELTFKRESVGFPRSI